MHPQDAGLPNLEHPAEVSWDYFHGIAKCGVPMTAIPLYIGRFTPDSRWNLFQEHMNGVLADRYINVVCGQGDGFQRGWTRFHPNVAILGAYPLFRTHGERAALTKYQFVIVPSEEYRQRLLADYGLEVPPEGVVPASDAKGLLRVFRLFRDELKKPLEADSGKLTPEETEKAKAFVEKYVKDDPQSEQLGNLLMQHGGDVPLANYPKK